jgi:hypothetical protein
LPRNNHKHVKIGPPGQQQNEIGSVGPVEASVVSIRPDGKGCHEGNEVQEDANITDEGIRYLLPAPNFKIGS